MTFAEEDGDVDDGGWFQEAEAILFWKIERTIEVRARSTPRFPKKHWEIMKVIRKSMIFFDFRIIFHTFSLKINEK